MGQKWSQPVESPCIRINVAGIYGVDAAVAVAPSHWTRYNWGMATNSLLHCLLTWGYFENMLQQHLSAWGVIQPSAVLQPVRAFSPSTQNNTLVEMKWPSTVGMEPRTKPCANPACWAGIVWISPNCSLLHPVIVWLGFQIISPIFLSLNPIVR